MPPTTSPSDQRPFVHLCDVGPRDGFQFETKPIPTDFKVECIRLLAEAGLPEIQVASFVHPKRVPQMADAEEVCARLPIRKGVRYTGLALNERGVERAARAGLRSVEVSVSTNETQSLRNANRTLAEARRALAAMLVRCRTLNLEAQANLQVVFGYREPGDTPLDRVVDMVRAALDAGADTVSLADSTGLANPASIVRVVRAVQEATEKTPLVLHMHDTRGLGLANVTAALGCGVRRLDTSFGGLGGCPFIPGATGNIATEDTVYLLESMGYRTGVDRERVAEVSRRMAGFLDRSLSGKLYDLPEGP